MSSGRVVVVCGPTASGKTALSVALARRWNGEVVSADSMQIYRGMDVGTAKPTMEERAGVPHYMLDVAQPGERYSVSCYVQEASYWIDDILSRGKLPIICGGTGLYIDALLRGSAFQESGAESGLRDALEEEWQVVGGTEMLLRLSAVDPESAARLHEHDKRRILRALEVYRQTGETISVHNARTQALPPRYDSVKIGLTAQPREILYQRIDRRVTQMLEQGLGAEARALLDEGLLCGTAAQAIGYKELLAYFHGETTLEAAADCIRQKSRNYAKRQLTWFRRDPQIHWIFYNAPESGASVLQEATEYLRHSFYNEDVNF